MAAILVYAAAINIGLAATTLFHDAYKAGEEALAENFSHHVLRLGTVAFRRQPKAGSRVSAIPGN